LCLLRCIRPEKERTVWLKTIGLVGMLALVLLTALLAANAQPSTKVYRIGWLSPGSTPPGPNPSVEAFQQGLRDLGYVEGQTLVIEYRYAEDNVERLPDLAAELVRLHVDVIVTGGSTPAALAAKQATSTIPIIMAGIGSDPVAAGLVANLARPGGNVTGVTARGTEGWEKRLELLKEAVPRLSRVAILWNPANPGNALFCLREVKAVALAMGVQLHALEVHDANAFERAFAEIAQEPPRRAPHMSGLPDLRARKTYRGLRGEEPPADDDRDQRICAGWGAHVLWDESP
jgi:putative ABC transport system substrate-binding protein